MDLPSSMHSIACIVFMMYTFRISKAKMFAKWSSHAFRVGDAEESTKALRRDDEMHLCLCREHVLY